jgi:acetoin utilization deacetylase AcuC-like enzyme
LTEETYAGLSSGMRALSQEISAPLGFVLEGGYDLRALASSVAATMAAARGDGELPVVAAGPLATRARSHYARWWPSLEGD